MLSIAMYLFPPERRQRRGFTVPYVTMWIWALGPVQMAAYHSCLWNTVGKGSCYPCQLAPACLLH
jgi:hypothetical protein